MATIAELQNAVKAAEDYLVAVSQNLPCGGTCSGFTGAATVNEQFRIQREKDAVAGNIRLTQAKQALEQGITVALQEITTQAQKATTSILLPETKKNITPLLILAGLITAVIILK